MLGPEDRSRALVGTIFTAAAGLLGCAGQPEPPDPAIDHSITVTIASEEVDRRLEAGDLQGADRLLAAIMSHPGFDGLDEQWRHDILHVAATTASKLKEPARAKPLFHQASEMTVADSADWHGRVRTAYALGDMPEAVRSLTTIARRWPEALPTQNIRGVLVLLRESRKPPVTTEESFALHRALFEARWQPEEPYELSWAWRSLALMLIDRGLLEDATQAASRVDSPEALVGMRVDKRFDVVTTSSRPDPRASLQRYVARMREHSSRTPRRLDDVAQLTYALLHARRIDDALTLTAPFAGEHSPTSAFVLEYADWHDTIIWMLDYRSRALQAKGRWKEAVAVQRASARKGESGDLNVSQAINLGRLLCNIGQPEEARRAIAEVGGMSPFGRMSLESVRLCSAVGMKDQQGIDAALTYMREHRSDGIGLYQRALVEAGRLDEAAALLKERVTDGSLRTDALEQVQRYFEPSGPRYLRDLQERWRQFLRRPDVSAAINEVGRIENFEYMMLIE